MPRATVPPKLEQWGAQVLGALPPRVQVRLSGKPPVAVDGDTLAPEAQLLLAVLERRNEPPLETLSPADAQAGAPSLDASRTPADRYRSRRSATLDIDGMRWAVTMRHPSPAAPTRCSCTTTAAGSPTAISTPTTACAGFSAATRVRTSWRSTTASRPSIRFRPRSTTLARRCSWAFANAGRIGADPTRIGVGGDSAGGNLAAVVSQLAARDGGPAPALQLLIYPATDMTTRHRSRDLFAEGFLLTDSEMDWFEDNYLGVERTHANDPRASPLRAEDLSGLAPAFVVTASFDPLRDEGEAYAEPSKTPAPRPRSAGSRASSTASSTLRA